MVASESLAARPLEKLDPAKPVAAKPHTGLGTYTLNDVRATNKVTGDTASQYYPPMEVTGAGGDASTSAASKKVSDSATPASKAPGTTTDGSKTETLTDSDGKKWIRRTEQNGNYTEDQVDEHGKKTGEHSRHTKNPDGSTDDESVDKNGIKKTLHTSADYHDSTYSVVDTKHKGKDGKPVELSREESKYDEKAHTIDQNFYEHGQKVKNIHKNKDSSRDETEYKDGKPHKLDRYNNAGKLVGTYDLPYKDYDSNGKLVDRYDVPDPSQNR